MWLLAQVKWRKINIKNVILDQVKWSKMDKYKEVWLLDQVSWSEISIRSKINLKKWDYWIKESESKLINIK